MKKRPNIVFILSDQHNAQVMGNAGDEYIRTPNMDRLFEQGVKLDQCYCNSPVCVPSRMSLLTGLLPQETRAMNNFQSLYSDTATIAHAVGIAGYETVLSGRMHFCGPDQLHGFEKRFVGDLTPNYHRSETFTWIYEDFGESMKQKRIGIEKAGAGSTAVYDFDAQVTDEAIRYMKERTDDRPMFMTVGLYAPHPPFLADSQKFDYYYEKLPELETDPDFREHLHPAMLDWLKRRDIEDIDPLDKRRMRAAYYALVENLDEHIGQIIDGVAETLGLDNTIIVYASDHGESMGINDFYWKTTFFESSVRVPAIISWPKNYASGTCISEPTCLLDLTESFLEWTDAPKLPGTYGRSLIPVLEGQETIEEDRSIISQIGSYPLAQDKPSAMIKKGRWKLIEFYGYDHPSLFNLVEDPMEINDLGNSETYRALRESLETELHACWDAEKAFTYCNWAFEHFKLTKKWAEHTQYEFPKVWRCVPGTNYLLREMEEERQI